jgi:hypothetical protein
MEGFKKFIENDDIFSKIIDVSTSVFPEASVERHDYGTTYVHTLNFPSGRTMNLSWYEHDPGRIQVGFSVENRERFGPPSVKDPASNANLMPDSLGFMKKLGKLVQALRSIGLEPWYHAINARREHLFSKIFNQ